MNGWAVCCDFHSEPREIARHLRDWGRQYGKTEGGLSIEPPPAGWTLLPYREVIPRVYCEYHEGLGWLGERRGHSTMSPIFARPAGRIRAYAVPVGATR